MYNDIQIIIMAGGVGSRFWPMSTPDYPKQFIDVMGVGRSLIQLTVDTCREYVGSAKREIYQHCQGANPWHASR